MSNAVEINISKESKRKDMSLRHNIFYFFVAKCMVLSLFLLLLLPLNAHSDTLIHTLQLGSFLEIEQADKLFDHTVSRIEAGRLDNLRIEQRDKYYTVRLGKFDSNTDAKKFRQSIPQGFDDLLIVKAYIKEDKIKRRYHDASPAEHEAVHSYTPPEFSGKKDLATDRGSGGENEAVAETNDTVPHVSNKLIVNDDNESISISIQDADIKSVLKALSRKKKLNIVAGKDVTGKISVNLHDVPLQDALDAVIAHNGFTYVKKDDIMFVTKADENSGEDETVTDIMIFKLKYVDVEAVETVISKLISAAGKITVYKPEKTLIIEDDPRILGHVKKVLTSIDVPPRQVLIEAKILEVRLNDDASLGIDWNDTFRGLMNSQGTIETKGLTGISKGFVFNLMNSDFNLVMDAIQTITDVNTLSTPKLLALDNKEAKILIGDKLGYNVTTTVENTVLQSVEFLDTGTQLILTPHIVDDDTVVMDIYPKISDGSVINGLPSETTTEVVTTLIAPNGGTIFIGGLIRDRKEDVISRVPGLGAIPIFGALFSKTNNITVRTELIILITPHIITAANSEILEMENQKVNEAKDYLKQERSLKELVPGTK